MRCDIGSHTSVIQLYRRRRSRNLQQQENSRPMFALRPYAKTALKIVMGLFLALLLQLPASPTSPASLASAHAIHPASTSKGGPTLQVNVGFDGNYRFGYWTPVYVNLSNNGPDFKGTLSLKVYTGSPRTATIGITSPWSFEKPVTLLKDKPQLVTLYVPLYLGNFTPQGVVATLSDEHGRVITTQTGTSGYEIKEGDLFIGILSDTSADFGTLTNILDNVSLPNQTSSLTTAQLNAGNLPTQVSVLANFDVIILDDFTTSTLSPTQLSALRTWVNQGGVLIEVGGPAWQRTLNALPIDLLPVALNGLHTLPAGTPLLAPGGSPTLTLLQIPLPEKLPEPAIASAATLHKQSALSSNETVLAADSIPLFVQARQGQGVLCYLAIDPAASPLATWPGTDAVLRMMLLHALGDQFLIPSSTPGYISGPGQILTRGGILNMVQPGGLAGPWILAAFLLGYLLLLGPIRFFIVRRFKLPRWWNWRIFLSGVIVFSFLSYGLAVNQRGASIMDTSISLIQINQNGSTAHITNYLGIFVPDQGVFDLSIPGGGLIEPITDQLISNTHAALVNDEPTSIIAGSSNLNLQRQAPGPWTFHPLVSEQESQLQGGLVAHLSLDNNKLVGTISNTLNTSLSDLYVLLPHGFAAIGHLAAGEQRQVNLPLYEASAWPGESLADQIAEHNGLPASYFPYTAGQAPQTDLQRHIALLSALSGDGYNYAPCSGPCNTHAITTGGVIYITGGRVPNPSLINNHDPLLVTGSPATLIGWADQDLAGVSNMTINGTHPTGRHESFIQMPINLGISSPLNIPPDFIAGRVTDIQSYDAEMLLPGIYSMITGSLTFEFILPDLTNLPIKSLTVTEPDLLANPAGPRSGPPLTLSHLQAQLYNWYTNSWNTIKLNQDIFTTTNPQAYIGPSQQVLMQVSNQDSSQGKLFFMQPSLSLDGSDST